MVLERAVLRFGSVMCEEIEVGAICGECRDFCMTSGVSLSHVGESLVSCVNHRGSVISALHPRFPHVSSGTLPLSSYLWQGDGAGIVSIEGSPQDVIVRKERPVCFCLQSLDKVRLWGGQAIVEPGVCRNIRKCPVVDLTVALGILLQQFVRHDNHGCFVTGSFDSVDIVVEH